MKQSKTSILLIIITIGCLRCTSVANCDIDSSNKYIDISDSEIQLLDNLNSVIINHFEDLKSNNSAQYISEYKMNLTPYLIRRSLKSDSLIFDKYYDELKQIQPQKKSRGLNLRYILISPVDTSIDYEIRSDFCQSENDMIVWHRLLYSLNTTNRKEYKRRYFIKEKTINRGWTYYIKNEQYLGR
jgi:hypothetical protein